MGKDILDFGGYSIIKRIGTGARSTIYLATDDEDGTKVALKRVTFERPEDSRIFEQVESEHKVAHRIDHPYVRKCFELRKTRSMFKVKEMLLAMEYFEGKNLEDCSTLGLGDVLLVFRMVASGLNAMHQHGFVHCDIKPNNILSKIGTVKPRIQGTPDYIAPEQVKRKPLGPKTDIFNLGATMYWALTGKHAPTMIPKKNKFGLPIIEPRRAPHEIKKQLPVGISKLVMDCIEDDLAQRPRNMMMIMSRLDLMVHSIFGGKIKTNKNASNNHASNNN
jgi:serine/threonine-protein kinase